MTSTHPRTPFISQHREARRDSALDRPIAEVMTREPLTLPLGSRVAEALEILKRRKISELPVVDADNRPVGNPSALGGHPPRVFLWSISANTCGEAAACPAVWLVEVSFLPSVSDGCDIVSVIGCWSSV